MSLQEKLKNIKPLWQFLDVGLIAASIIGAFMLGQASVELHTMHTVEVLKAEDFKVQVSSSGAKSIFASRSGTKYYYPWCSGAGRIKEENKVWFANSDEAKAKGYEKAKNCPGD